MRHQDPRGQRAQQVVIVAVAATGRVADLEAVGQAAEDAQHLLDASYAGAVDNLPGLVESAEGDVAAVNIEPNVQQRGLLKSESVKTCTTYFHVTGLTEAP